MRVFDTEGARGPNGDYLPEASVAAGTSEMLAADELEDPVDEAARPRMGLMGTVRAGRRVRSAGRSRPERAIGG